MPKRKSDQSGSDYTPSDKSDVEEEFEGANARASTRAKSMLILTCDNGESPTYYVRDVKHAPKAMHKMLAKRLKLSSEDPLVSTEFTDVDLTEEDAAESLIECGLVEDIDDDEKKDKNAEEARAFLLDSLSTQYTPASLTKTKICWVISISQDE